MLDPKRIKSRGLRRLAEQGERAKINPAWVPRIERLLGALDAAKVPEDLNLPGNGFHQLRGDRQGTYSVKVTANWRLTFRWDQNGPFDIELEDYHGN